MLKAKVPISWKVDDAFRPLESFIDLVICLSPSRHQTMATDDIIPILQSLVSNAKKEVLTALEGGHHE